MRCAVAAVVATTLWLTAPRPAIAQTAPPPSADDVQKALEARRNELEATQSRAGIIEKDVAELNSEREKINARLVETAATIQKSEAQLTKIEDRMGELEAQEKLVRGSLSQRHGQIAKLLSALQRMGRNPPPVLITKREDALHMVRSAMLLAAAFPGMRKQALALTDTLNDLMRVTGDIRTEGEKLRAETTRLSDMRTRLAGLMETKRQSITERQAELKDVRRSADEISKSVTDLNELIAKLDEAVTKNTALQAYNAETQQVAAAAAAAEGASAPVPSADAPQALSPEPALPAASEATAGASPGQQDKPVDVAAFSPAPKPSGAPVVELAPAGTSLVPGSAGRIKPAIAFHLAKAKLPLPAQGRRVLSFGEKTQYGATSKGMVIETRSGAQITSPCDGWVVYAGDFRSYGKLLIINAGGGYHVLVAGLSQIDAQPGQFVLAAEPVGTMSSAAARDPGSAQSGAPVLYIEFRKDGEPINPDPWWVESLQKAQG